MTVIVARDGVLAADSAVFVNDLIAGYQKKIRRLNDGRLVGLTGTSAQIQKLIAFLNGDTQEAVFPADEMPLGLMLELDGTIRKIEGKDIFTIDCPYAAAGAPLEMAYGALGAGATAIDAVKICIERHVWCGGAIHAEIV